MYTVEELHAQKAAGKTVYDKAKDTFLTEAEWETYMRKTHESEKPDCTFEEWCNDSGFVDIDNMLGKLEA